MENILRSLATCLSLYCFIRSAHSLEFDPAYPGAKGAHPFFVTLSKFYSDDSSTSPDERWHIFCSGILITTRVIMTAASCFVEDTPRYENMIIKVADYWVHNISTSYLSTAKHIYIHPMYEGITRYRGITFNWQPRNDLALVVLDQEVSATLYSPLHLPMPWEETVLLNTSYKLYQVGMGPGDLKLGVYQVPISSASRCTGDPTRTLCIPNEIPTKRCKGLLQKET